MLVCVRLTLTRFFFADSIPFRIACGTSLALPEPYPTTAADGSPTTTSAANERFLPPLTTLVTRLMATTWSFNWNEFASSFLITIGILEFSFRGFQITKLPDYQIPKSPRTAIRLRAPHRPAPSPGRDKCSRRGQTPPCSRLWPWPAPQ